VGQREGKRPLERPRHRWDVNSKVDLKEISLVYMDLIAMAQDREKWQAVVNVVMNLQTP
jgi:hypothetical protein